MRILTRLSIATLAALGFGLAAATGGQVGAAIADSCNETCFKGGEGTGGASSDGKAQGFRIVRPAVQHENSVFTNSGNDIAGHFSISGEADVVSSGAFTPQGDVVGHYEGHNNFPDCSGQCG